MDSRLILLALRLVRLAIFPNNGSDCQNGESGKEERLHGPIPIQLVLNGAVGSHSAARLNVNLLDFSQKCGIPNPVVLRLRLESLS